MIRAAVIGAGYLGRYHAQKYRQAPGVKLVAVAEIDAAKRAAIHSELGVDVVEDFRELLGQIDAASVVTPTRSHHRVAQACLNAGVDILLEKPMTATLDEARELIDVARRRERILQIGLLERFNPVLQAAQPRIGAPRFVESARLAPFKTRGTEVNVVLDLMIHDIDLILSLVASPLISVDAIGSSVFSREIDIANARLRFANGCVANATASRISLKSERKLRVFEDAAYMSIDLQHKILTRITKGEGVSADGTPQVVIAEESHAEGDALQDEIEAFCECVRSRSLPLVGGMEGLRALETALDITEQVRRQSAAFSA